MLTRCWHSLFLCCIHTYRMPVQLNEIKESRNYQINDKNERTYTRTWRAVTDDPQIGGQAVVTALGLAIGNQYLTATESDTYAYCLSITADNDSDDGRTWVVTAEYGPYPQTSQNPLEEPVDISWGFAQFTKTVDRDLDGEAITNSAGDPYQTPVEIDDSRPVLSIIRNEAVFDYEQALEYRDKLNSDDFFGCEPETVKVSNITARRVFDPIYSFYWQVTYEFHIDKEGFEKKLLDQGMRELDQLAGKRVPLLVGGIPVSEPHLLDGLGIKLAEDAQPVFETYKVYDALPFSVFNLEA